MPNRKKFKQNDNNLAVAYYRYSSHSQNEASNKQQQEWVKKFAQSKGYNIVHEYWDEGVSGTIAERHGYQTMLSELDAIKPNAVLVWKTDRLGQRQAGAWICKKAVCRRRSEAHFHIRADAQRRLSRGDLPRSLD